MGENEFIYSTDVPTTGQINPLIAAQLAAFQAEEKGPHIDVPENPAGGIAETVVSPSSQEVSSNFTSAEARQRSADLLTEAMDAKGVDPEAVLGQARVSGFVTGVNPGLITPKTEVGQPIVEAYNEKKADIAATPAESSPAATPEKSEGRGHLRTDLNNINQKIDSMKRNMSQAVEAGEGREMAARLLSLAQQQAEITERLASESAPAKGIDAQSTPPVGVPETIASVEDAVPREELPETTISTVKKHERGRFASGGRGERILRSKGELPLVTPPVAEAQGTSQEAEPAAAPTPDVLEAEPVDESRPAEAAEVPEVELPQEPEIEQPVDSPEMPSQERTTTPEEVIERQKTIEARARESKVFLALEERIHENENIPQPLHKGFLSRAYLFVMHREQLESYNKGQEDYRKAQRENKELDRLRLTWVERESKLYDQGFETGAKIIEISGRIATGEADKREQAKAHKLLGKLVAKREAIDIVFAQEVAARIGLENFTAVVRPVWEGIDTRPKLSEEERQVEGREVFDFVDRERSAREAAVRWLQTELTPDGLPVRPEQEGLGGLLEKLHLGAGETRSLRDLSPEAQRQFFMEEANGSLAELGGARALVTAIEGQVSDRAEDGGAAENPLALFQLYTGLRTAKLAERQAEAQVRNALDRVSRGESLAEMKGKVVQKIKQAVGDKVFKVEDNFEVTAETRLGELALSGSGALSEAVYRGWQDWNALRIMGHRTAHGVVNLRRAFNQKFAQVIPESTEAAQKSLNLTATLAEIDARRGEVSEATDSITKIRRAALESRRAVLEAMMAEEQQNVAEQERQNTDSIVEGMIFMLIITKQNKDELRRLYETEGLSDVFLDTLLEYYQRSKLNLERRKGRVEAEVAELSVRREWLWGIVGRAAEGAVDLSLDEIEQELTAIEHEIAEKTLAIQDRIDIIWRDYRAQMHLLEGQLDEEMYRAVLEKLA
jgi:hypothetical protein